MKKMTRMQLINWHMFTNKLVDIRGNTLLTGENGSGKSTLIDAMQYLLTGGTAKFNMAANVTAKRDLKGYIRGKLGIEGQEFLRDGDVTTHLALEYYDEQTGIYQVLGCVFELNESNQKTERFYTIYDVRLDEDFFIFENRARRWKEFVGYFEQQGITLVYRDKLREVKMMFSQALGVQAKYFELIPRALAFKPINELNDFIFDFLLVKDNLKVESLQGNIRKYREFDKVLKNQQERLVLLGEVGSTYKVYQEIEGNIDQAASLFIYTKAEELNEKIRKNEEVVAKNNVSVTVLGNQNKGNEIERIQLEEEWMTVSNQLGNNESYIRIKELEQKLAISEKEHIRLHAGYQEFLVGVQQSQELGLNLGLKQELLTVAPKMISQNPEQVIELLTEIDDYSRKQQAEQFEQRHTSRENLRQLSQNISDINQTISLLKTKKFEYPVNVRTLIEVLNEGLTKEFGEQISIKPFCEYLEIKDEVWRDAIEGYLNTQRFNLLIEPQYFAKALELYEQQKQKKGLYGVAIVDCQKLAAFSTTGKDSLANLVKTTTQHARHYANFLLNDVICVANLGDLRNHQRAITSTCMLYSKFSVSAINPHIYQKPYIGQKALETQLKEAILRLASLEKHKISENQLLGNAEAILLLVATNNCPQILKNGAIVEQYHEIVAKIAIFGTQLAELNDDPSWATMQKQLTEIKETTRALTAKIANIAGQKAVAENDIVKALEKLAQLAQPSQEALKQVEHQKQKYPEIWEQVKKDYLKAYSRYNANFTAMQERAQRRKTQAELAMMEQKIVVIQAMRAFNSFTNLGFGEVLDEIDTYMQQCYLIESIEIEKSREAVKDAQLKCEQSFQEAFISQLRVKIKMAKNNLKQLNENLKTKMFGTDNERYEFVFGPSKSISHREYYDIVMSGQDHYQDNLFISTLSEQNRKIMNDLFETLSSVDDDSQNEKILEKYLDYRYYMAYDIKITNDKNQVTYFSKVNKEKSGGETQTPFYVIIAASFEQLLKNNGVEDSGCVVLFDEAFNNMDESRIDAMMRFYHELNIQVVIAVPPSRIQTITPYVDTVLTLVKNNNQVYLKEFIKNGQQEN
ncbi:MAG: ATP-binding protein [Culicoidibacterales bacterium]